MLRPAWIVATLLALGVLIACLMAFNEESSPSATAVPSVAVVETFTSAAPPAAADLSAAQAPSSVGIVSQDVATKRVKITPYPTIERQQFLRGCVGEEKFMHDFCVCVLVKFQETMTFEEFTAMNKLTDEQLRNHAPYTTALLGCAPQQSR